MPAMHLRDPVRHLVQSRQLVAQITVMFFHDVIDEFVQRQFGGVAARRGFFECLGFEFLDDGVQ